MKTVSSFCKGFVQFLLWFNIILMGFLASAVVLTVILRYVFDVCFIWAEEFIIFTFIATTYFGIILCVKEGEHIEIDFFKNLAPPVVRLIIETFIAAVVIFTLLFLAKVSLEWIGTVGSTLTPGLKIPCRYIYIMMPISFVLSSLFELVKIIQKWIAPNKAQISADI